MSELRWILLIAGLLLVVAIFVYGRIQRRKSTAGSQRLEPSFTSAPPVAPSNDLVKPEAQITPDPEPVSLYAQSDLPLVSEPETVSTEHSRGSTKTKEKIIAIHVAARSGRRFNGPAVVDALGAESLEFGDFEIFHRRTGNRSIFSVSSMVEPGTFNIEAMDDYTTPGLTMFMIMPGPDSPISAFTEMLSTARRLATTLDGEVLDESGSTLSRQAASHLREQIIEFAHRVR